MNNLQNNFTKDNKLIRVEQGDNDHGTPRRNISVV